MRSICTICRMADPPCNHPKFLVGPRWRIPKKSDNKAWRYIESGDIWWDKRHIARTADKYIWQFGKPFGSADKRRRRLRKMSPEDLRAERNRLAEVIARRRKKLEENRDKSS